MKSALLKRIGKSLLCTILEAQVKRLRKRQQFKLIAVAGGVGKTSTKLAIAETLADSHSVRYQKGNYNDRLTVPLVLFGQRQPGLFNILAWLKIILANRKAIRQPYPYEYVVVELGTDGPGQMAAFGYLHPDITVITALVPEHMEFFGTMDAVAVEELSITNSSKRVLINTDDSPATFLADKRFISYGSDKKADYRILKWQQRELETGELAIALPGGATLETKLAMVGKPAAKIALAAAAVAHMAGLAQRDIAKGLTHLQPFAGRMQILDGIRGSTIIDDTYNASPPAVEAALDVLYGVKAPQRIAVLGSMNQMGDYSFEAHREVGTYCNAEKLDLVVTVGSDAEKYLAPYARKAGCEVQSFSSPYQASEFVKRRLKKGSIILAKGSQDRIFAEESLKALLKDPKDAAKLVRQSTYWMKIKRKQFSN
ncbi:MAG TPA: Mur ligase family protein [Candidatus Saccharimonadales bacterium]|jgi:UDP-N-acetylmuramoyl-tripeptide--D-alanyl-D-alanine ligase|nr:Mur ligase family protein [Candidatus Saccharimonadales bacterium]